MLDAACDPVLAYSARGGPKDLGRKTAVGARDEAHSVCRQGALRALGDAAAALRLGRRPFNLLLPQHIQQGHDVFPCMTVS